MQFGGTFWHTFRGFTTSNSLTTLLEKPETTLPDLLDDDTVIQELKNQNQKLIEFLNESRIQEMIDLITKMPEDTVDHKRGHKHPFIVSELFSTESPSLLDQFFTHSTLLENLFDYLKSAEKAPILDGYFSKLASLLLSKNPAGILEFLSQKERFSLLSNSFSSKSISDFVQRVLQTEVSSNFAGVKQDLVSSIFALIMEDNELVVNYAGSLIVDIIRQSSENLGTKEIVHYIATNCLKNILEAAKSDYSLTISVALEILKQLLISPIKDELLNTAKGEDSTIAIEDSEFSKQVIQIIPALVKRLKRKSESFLGTSKTNLKILGQDRLKISEFFLCLAKLEKNEFFKALNENSVFETLTELFIEFDSNSIFHNLFENYFSVVFDYYANEEEILKNLLERSKILEHLALENFGKGYAGHAVKIGISITKIKARNTEFSRYLEDCESWKSFFFEFYVIRNEIERKTLGENKSKVPDESSSEDNGRLEPGKDPLDQLLSKDEYKDDEEDLGRDEPEADSEPFVFEDIKGDKDNYKIFGETIGKSSSEYEILDMKIKELFLAEIPDEEYWIF